MVIVHRDLGPGFTHFDSRECPCVPHIIPDNDERPTDVIVAEIEEKERRGDA